MKLKELKEQRNALLDKADEMVNLAETEVRGLNETEVTAFDGVKEEIRSLNTQIQELENRQNDGEKIENMEERTMEQKDLEVRGLEQFLRKQNGEEYRTLQQTTDGAAVVPENVEGSIVAKMEFTSPVFAKARKFPSVNGTLKIAKETALSTAGFVGEGTNVAELALALGDVTLTQKRVGAAISLSNQLIHDTAINIVTYATDLLSRRCAKAIEKSILLGTGVAGQEFNGIFGDTDIVKVDTATANTVVMDDLNGLYNALHPEYLDQAVFICSRAFYQMIAKFKDGNNHYFVQNGVVNGKLTKTLFGAEVIVSDAITSTQYPVIFGSVEDAYGIMVKQGFSLQHVTADTTQALRGSQLLVLDGYMDGAVFNSQAIVKLNVKTA